MTQEEQLNSISVSFTADSSDDESNQDASRVLRKLLPGATSEFDGSWDEPSTDQVNEIEEDPTWEANVNEADITDDPVRMYLREIGKVNLLNAQGEKDLAKQVENGKTIKRFLRENADQDNPNIFMLKNFIKHIGSNTDLIKELKLKTETEETEDFSVKDILTGKESITHPVERKEF